MTAVAVIWGPDEIVAAADSKEVGADSSPNPICKIHAANGSYFVFSGMGGNEETGYDPRLLAIEACKKGGSIGERASVFAEIVIDPLVRAIQYVQTHYPSDYEAHLLDRTAIGISFFGPDGNGLAITSWQYKTSGETARRDATDYRAFVPILAAPAPTRQQFMLGRTVDQLRGEPRAMAKKFIEMAIANSPEVVGAPIHVLSVSRAGAQWLERTDACPDI